MHIYILSFESFFFIISSRASDIRREDLNEATNNSNYRHQEENLSSSRYQINSQEDNRVQDVIGGTGPPETGANKGLVLVVET